MRNKYVVDENAPDVIKILGSRIRTAARGLAELLATRDWITAYFAWVEVMRVL